MIYGNSIILKSNKFYLYIGVCILLAGLFNVFAIFSQYFDLFSSSLGIWIAEYSEYHGRPYGNFGQPNLVSTLLLTSLCCGIFLYRSNVINLFTLLLLASFFGIALAFPSSKTAFLCLLFLITVSVFLKDKAISLVFIVASISMVFTKTLATSTRNIDGSDLTTGRSELWFTMLNALWKSPWIGYGALNTRIAHFQSRELDVVPRGQVIGSSHNLVLDFLIWFGLILGIVVSTYFIKIVIKYLLENKNNPSKIYIIFPILIHSQLEYPLYYANFLFIFSFFINSNKNSKTAIKYKVLPFAIVFAVLVLFFVIVLDYLKISQKYTELRFYNNKFLNAKRPDALSPMVLDLTGGQYNIFIRDEIKDEADLRSVMRLTRSMPSLNNYHLIIKYLRENNYSEEEINFWLNKARASFNVGEISSLENKIK